MKKRTLNQTWVLCLRMWRSISKAWPKTTRTVSTLKVNWLTENGFNGFGYEVEANCFFCQYATGDIGCHSCPGRLVNPDFDCNADDYNFDSNPPAFYKELLRLNRIRKGKK